MTFSLPANAQTNINNVDSGRWKFVSSISTILNLYPGYIKIFVSPLNAVKTPLFTADSKLLTTVVPTASILPP